PVLGGLGRQQRSHRRPPGLARHRLFVVSGMGPENDAAVPPLRRSGAALAGAARALLTPRLGIAARHRRPCFGRSRALAQVGHLPHGGLVNRHVLDRRGEDLVVEVDLVDHLAGHVVHGNLRHGAYPFFFRPAALTAFLTKMSALLAPGTAPSTRSRLRSASTSTTFRFCTVTRTSPRWPAMRWPL